MTESEQPGRDRRGGEWPSELEAGPPEARRRITRWPGWIWAVPLAAVIFVVWLGVREWLFAAPTVTVAFDSVEGVSMGTPLQHKGVRMGAVESVRLSPDLGQALVTLRIEGPMSEHLGEGAAFWIVRPELGAGGVSSLIGGAHVAMKPGERGYRSRFEGLDEPPVLVPDRPGMLVVLEGPAAAALEPGAPVRLDALEVGRIVGRRHHPETGRLELYAFVDERYRQRVRSATVFWRGKGFSVSAGSGGVQVDLPSLSALTGGSVELHTPSVLAGSPVADGTRFRLHRSRGEALATPGGPRLAYRVRLPGPAGDLQPGAPVTLQGREVGHVGEAGFEMDPRQGIITIPATLVLDATRFGLEAEGSRDSLREALDRRLTVLVARGLRARAAATPILGSAGVELAVLEDAPGGELMAGGETPELPAVATAPDLRQTLDTVARTVRRLGGLPLNAIAADLADASRRLKQLAESPEIEAGMDSLAEAVEHMENVAEAADARAGTLLDTLEGAADAVESAAASIDRLSGGTVRQNRDMAELVSELTDTARSVRRLADYLARHPEALIQGRERRR